MNLTCGYMTIKSNTINSKDKKFDYSGQICVDGVETFLVYKRDNLLRFYPYSKREFVYENVLEHFGETLDEVIENLVFEKSKSLKQDKKNLAKMRKADRDSKKIKKTV